MEISMDRMEEMMENSIDRMEEMMEEISMDRMEEIARLLLMGKDPKPVNAAERELVKEFKEEFEEAERNGWAIEIPHDIPLLD